VSSNRSHVDDHWADRWEGDLRPRGPRVRPHHALHRSWREPQGHLQGLKQGEEVEFRASLEEARHVALERQVEHAQSQGADAVVGLRFDSTDMGQTQGMAEILAYGTAVKLAP
jgi:uncharacterized protein YbjQ (UPF0145 family)